MANGSENGSKRVEKGLQFVGGVMLIGTLALYVTNLYQRMNPPLEPVKLEDFDKLFLGAGLVLLLWPTLSSLKIANVFEVSRLKEEVKEAKAAAGQAQEIAKEAKEEAAAMPKLVGTSAREENREGGRIAKLALEEGRGKPGLEGIDPNFGRFGGQLSANDRFISAEVVGGSDPNWYQIKLHVRSTDSARPISGPVEFHLHPTF
jgi:hypothetical protein